MPGYFLLAAPYLRGALFAAGLGLAACAGPSAPGPAAPQWAADSATVKLAAGPQYARSRAWCFWWGAHYRAVWAMPVTVPVLHLATAVPGGLSPLQAGGSFQSHTLRLCAPDGREFVLRSVDKDASVALPAGWIRELLKGLMRDQTSAGLPYGAYVAASLAEAAAVYHTTPRLVFLPPHEPGMGKFGPAYINKLYLLEERPSGNERANAGFGHSTWVVNTAHLLNSLAQHSSAQVNARAYLRARLLDIWLGDWSRREDQWRWASFARGSGVSYRPVPRDRDQAFFLFDDGLLTRLVSWAVPKYRSFHASLGPGAVVGLTATARALDHALLGGLSAADFRQEADSLCVRLTNAAIDHALAQGPPETLGILTARLGPLLRARRAQLPAAAQEYFATLAQESWVVGTDQPERFVIGRGSAPGRVKISKLLRRGALADSLVSEQEYDQKTTARVKVYGLAGDDVFEVLSPLPAGPAIDLYPGNGHNRCVALPTLAQGALTWYGTAVETAGVVPASILTRANAYPEVTASAKTWLKRFNLRD